MSNEFEFVTVQMDDGDIGLEFETAADCEAFNAAVDSWNPAKGFMKSIDAACKALDAVELEEIKGSLVNDPFNPSTGPNAEPWIADVVKAADVAIALVALVSIGDES